MGPEGVFAEVKQVLYNWWGRIEPDAGATHFGVSAQVLIGSMDCDDADSFDCILCSPSMFAERFDLTQWGSGFAEDVLPGGDVLPVHGVWLMRAWSPAAFEAAVARLVTASSPGPDWGTVANRIGLHLPWEYDYRHDDELNQGGGLPRMAHSFWHDEARK
ncbi:Imm8 family immunity protein [Nocardioides sp. URHA0020]|uniref:Imm8 family immunity protein n=1 Tax=Nocardioides sp. URHA0020 TaxID=1380392 RepID=UPI00048B9357|nr:Imm8 family immunity protein [Nocardioides sp. URHA0020]